MNHPTGHVELANGALGNERVVEEVRKGKENYWARPKMTTMNHAPFSREPKSPGIELESEKHHK